MSESKTRSIPQVGIVENSESHTEKSVCLTDSVGGKNTTKTKMNRKMLTVATYNCKSLLRDSQLFDLENEAQNIKWDIIGLSEVRRKGEGFITLKSGNALLYRGQNTESHRGVGFLIKKKHVQNITCFKGISERAAYIILKISETCRIKIIQVYAPTSTYEDEDVELFYEDIATARKEGKCNHDIIMGDFNAILGYRQDNDEGYAGKFGLGTRNHRGHMLANFLENQKLYAMNTYFKKKMQRKWTWQSPDAKTKNEIDYILCSTKYIILDVTALNSFNTGSDHRLIRAKVIVTEKITTRPRQKPRKLIDTGRLKESRKKYADELTKTLGNVEAVEEDIDKLSQHLTTSIKETSLKVAGRTKSNSNKLTTETKQKIEERRTLFKEGKYGTEEYRKVSKDTRKRIRDDLGRHYERIVEEVIEKNANMKCLRHQIGRREIVMIRENDKEIRDREEILIKIEEFYRTLYSSQVQDNNINMENMRIINAGSEDIPQISNEEIIYALRKMKNDKAPGEDDILIEMIKAAEEIIIPKLKILFNLCLEKGEIPKSWNNAAMIILHKKGDPSLLQNYRPISLMSHLYKLFTKIITNRITNKLDQYQPVEQAAFRKGFSTCDHLLTVRILLEKANEYNLELYMAFVDYEKAFDSIEHWSIMNGLNQARVDSRYTNLIKNIYEHATSSVKVHGTTAQFPINRGIRQGDTLSPKLFTMALEGIFKELNWSDKGINICGERLNHLRFADDIVLFAEKIEDLKTMLTELEKKSRAVGLKMNLSKTKTMCPGNTQIIVGETPIENVSTYTYLGQIITLGKENKEIEIERRRRLAWAGFGKLAHILKNKKIPLHLRVRVFNQCIIPIMTYGAQTWTLTKQIITKLRVTQRAMERSMLGITLRDRKRNEWIRQRARADDVVETVAHLKWNYAGHVARSKENKWNTKIIQWRPWSGRRGRGRPQTRWYDDIKKTAGLPWLRIAQDRDRWRQLGEAYAQQWVQDG